MRKGVCSWLVLALLAPLAVRAGDDGFAPLLHGNDPAQFELVGISPRTLEIRDGEIRVTGTPKGYFATRGEYRNYVLRFDWKYERPEALASDARFLGNSGLLIHIQKPHKVWPRSIEVQLLNADAGHIFPVFGSKFEGEKDASAQKKAIKPVGQWNHQEVTCRNGKVSCSINGIEVARGRNADPDRGSIGWQSEGGPIRFRNLAIKPLD